MEKSKLDSLIVVAGSFGLMILGFAILILLPLLAAIVQVLSFFAPAIVVLILCVGGFWLGRNALSRRNNGR